MRAGTRARPNGFRFTVTLAACPSRNKRYRTAHTPSTGKERPVARPVLQAGAPSLTVVCQEWGTDCSRRCMCPRCGSVPHPSRYDREGWGTRRVPLLCEPCISGGVSQARHCSQSSGTQRIPLPPQTWRAPTDRARISPSPSLIRRCSPENRRRDARG